MSDLGQAETWEDAPDIIWDTSKIRTITATNYIDDHAPRSEQKKQLEEGTTDLGDGFLVHDEPVHIQRDASGGIVKLTPLSEIPGVHFQGTQMVKDPDLKTAKQFDDEAMIAEAKPKLVPLSKSSRDKLRHILATRLWNHYATEASLRNRNLYNPIRDGIPDVPAGSNKFLAPKGEELFRATEAQVYDWLVKNIAQRAKIVDTKRFGGGTLADMALHIE